MYYYVLFNRIYGNSKTTRGRKMCCIWKQFIMVYIEIQKSTLCICNDMLIYIIQVWKKVLFLKKMGYNN